MILTTKTMMNEHLVLELLSASTIMFDVMHHHSSYLHRQKIMAFVIKWYTASKSR